MSGFAPASGDWTVLKTPSKASTTYTVNSMLANDGTNDVMATAQTQLYIRGICMEAKSTASSATTSLSVLVPESQNCTFFGDMYSTETLSAANVGACFDFGADGLSVSTNTTYKPLQLVKYISTTRGEFKINLTTGIEN